MLNVEARRDNDDKFKNNFRKTPKDLREGQYLKSKINVLKKHVCFYELNTYLEAIFDL